MNQVDERDGRATQAGTECCCRLCGTVGLRLELVLHRAPRSIQRLLARNELGQDFAIHLRVYRCRECGLVQLTEAPEEGYYDDYVMTVSHSEQMRSYQRGQACEFVGRFALVGKKVLEVGCGDGNFLTYLREAGAVTFGLEPSARFRELAKARRVEVVAGYIERHTAVPGALYDAVVARQVLEHVTDINGFLQGLHNSLAEGAAGLVEVPSLEQALEGGRFYDFFADHVNYFSALTLRHALERNGFEVVSCDRGMGGEFLVALIRRTKPPELGSLQRKSERLVRELDDFVNWQCSAGRRVAIWGAGGKGNAVLALCSSRSIAYVVDSDPLKQGLFTPVSHFPIVPPETLRTEPVDVVIITAVPYQAEIEVQLRAMNFRGDVVLLGQILLQRPERSTQR